MDNTVWYSLVYISFTIKQTPSCEQTVHNLGFSHSKTPTVNKLFTVGGLCIYERSPKWNSAFGNLPWTSTWNQDWHITCYIHMYIVRGVRRFTMSPFDRRYQRTFPKLPWTSTLTKIDTNMMPTAGAKPRLTQIDTKCRNLRFESKIEKRHVF